MTDHTHHNICVYRRAVLIALGLCAMLESGAQEQFQLTNFVYSMHAINPAFSGVEDAVNLSAGFRRQWAAIEGAPITYYAGFNGSLNALKNANTNNRTLRKSAPRLYGQLRDEARRINHGVGLYFSSDAFGPFQKLSAFATYSLIYNVTGDYKIAAGISLEFANQRFRADRIALYNADLDGVYQSYASGTSNTSRMNFNTGALIYGKHLYAGYAVHHLGSMALSGQNFTETGYEGLYHFVSAGYSAVLGRQWTLLPSTLVRYNRQYDWQVDVVARLKYRDFVWGGVSWRRNDSAGLLVGFKLERTLFFTYSYEYNTGEIGGYSQGSHELVLAYKLFKDSMSTPFLY